MNPTVARNVHYYEFGNLSGNTPRAAIVAFVHSDTMINIGGWDGNGNPISVTSVEFEHDPGNRQLSKRPFACWPPQVQCVADAIKTVDAEAKTIEQLIVDSGKTGPRVKPQDIQDAIAQAHFINAAEAAHKGQRPAGSPLALLTLCILVLRNGFTVVGKSACAYPENFDEAVGREAARKDAESQVWPLLGYALRDRLYLDKDKIDGASFAAATRDAGPISWPPAGKESLIPKRITEIDDGGAPTDRA